MFVFFFFIQSISKGKNPTYVISWKKNPPNFNIGLYLDIYRTLSFKLGLMTKTTKFYILISAWMTLTYWFVEAYANFFVFAEVLSKGENSADMFI